MSRSSSAKRTRSTRRESAPPPTWDEKLIRALLPYRIEMLGLIAAFFGALILLNLPASSDSAFGWVSQKLRQLAGWGSYVITIGLLFGGLYLLFRRIDRRIKITAGQIIGVELIMMALLPLTHWSLGIRMPQALAGEGGGVVGWALSTWLFAILGPILTIILWLIFLILGFILLFQIRGSDIVRGLRDFSIFLERIGARLAPVDQVDVVGHGAHAPDEALSEEPFDEHQPLSTIGRSAQLPELRMLKEGVGFDPDPADIAWKRERIIETLADFGLPASIDPQQIRFGPTVTQFGVKPGVITKTKSDGTIHEQRVRVGQIAALQKDLALALAVNRLRIEAPVPGRGVVGIEAPNGDTSLVRLRPLLESAVYRRLGTPLAIGLGQDVAGMPIVTDIAKLPHLLIAGATGSGKSVCLNAMIANLIFNNAPDTLRLVLIDPKLVEMIRFNGLPHLLGNVETDHDRVIGVLRWMMAEMDQRYLMFANVGVRDLKAYNDRIMRLKGEGALPYIVMVIDELADLMAIYPADVERGLTRLAQMARATGIHLIVATQRPSTDVITGLIKANFPARIAFSVASSTDSRVIIDGVGAESLLGRGDMLFLPADASVPARVQGVYVDDDEIDRIVAYWENTLPNFDAAPAPWESLLARMNVIEQTDNMLERAVKFAQENENISTSLLQRKLRVGFPRAARLMEALYEMGMVEDPKTGGKTRRSLVSDDEGDALDDFLATQD